MKPVAEPDTTLNIDSGVVLGEDFDLEAGWERGSPKGPLPRCPLPWTEELSEDQMGEENMVEGNDVSTFDTIPWGARMMTPGPDSQQNAVQPLSLPRRVLGEFGTAAVFHDEDQQLSERLYDLGICTTMDMLGWEPELTYPSE